MMVSVDLFGFQRILDNPAPNFIYLEGEKPSRDSVVKAIKKGHTIAACGFSEADITCDGKLPGDEISDSAHTFHISACIDEGDIKEIRIYGDAELVYSEKVSAAGIKKDIVLPPSQAKLFYRVEISGEKDIYCLISTPFYINK